MKWLNGQSLIWEEPLRFAARFSQQDIALLYSGMGDAFSDNISYLFIDPIDTVSGKDWHDFPPSLPIHENDQHLPDWVGYLSYELSAPQPLSTGIITLPALQLRRYRYLYRFDHRALTLTAFSRDEMLPPTPTISQTHDAESFSLTSLASNFSKAEYEAIIASTVARIHAGDFYQANITRKFYGAFDKKPDAWAVFTALCAASPAPYSAYICHGDTAILSASPECFLQVDTTGKILTRPIKGSARRSTDAVEDGDIQQALKQSAKNHAENLMIVDLMRNDLAQVSIPESVNVVEQSKLYSYATIHHLISTVTAQRQPTTSLVDVIRACFPPGSMTGAPKIAAIDWCNRQEKMPRGIYSGAIGWLGSQGNCHLSVVIRTLILHDTQFEFQVGGGIVADSTPHEEWLETLAKARGILMALGLGEKDIAAL